MNSWCFNTEVETSLRPEFTVPLLLSVNGSEESVTMAGVGEYPKARLLSSQHGSLKSQYMRVEKGLSGCSSCRGLEFGYQHPHSAPE